MDEEEQEQQPAGYDPVVRVPVKPEGDALPSYRPEFIEAPASIASQYDVRDWRRA